MKELLASAGIENTVFIVWIGFMLICGCIYFLLLFTQHSAVKILSSVQTELLAAGMIATIARISELIEVLQKAEAWPHQRLSERIQKICEHACSFSKFHHKQTYPSATQARLATLTGIAQKAAGMCTPELYNVSNW